MREKNTETIAKTLSVVSPSALERTSQEGKKCLKITLETIFTPTLFQKRYFHFFSFNVAISRCKSRLLAATAWRFFTLTLFFYKQQKIDKINIRRWPKFSFYSHVEQVFNKVQASIFLNFFRLYFAISMFNWVKQMLNYNCMYFNFYFFFDFSFQHFHLCVCLQVLVWLYPPFMNKWNTKA